MSEELEWELFDIFEAALFHFPVYEHNTARKIVRYLLYRGVIAEEIADAIEDSTADLHLWLNRHGKNMVGEWVIAWINDTREEYLAEKAERGEEVDEGYQLRRSSIDRDFFSDYDSDDGGSGGEDGGRGTVERRPHSSRKKRRSRGEREEEEMERGADDMGERENLEGDLIPPDEASSDGLDIDDLDETEVKRRITPSPPPLPPRSLTLRRGLRDVSHLKHVDSSPESSDLEVDISSSPKEVVNMTFVPPREDFYERTPDSGAVSDIYSSVAPGDRRYRLSSQRTDSVESTPSTSGGLDDVDSASMNTIIRQTGALPQNHVPTDNLALTFDTRTNTLLSTHCPTHGTQRITTARGVAVCPNCTCTLAHYAYYSKPIMSVCTIDTGSTGLGPDNLSSSQDSLMQLTPPQQPTCMVHEENDKNCELYLHTETSVPIHAMDVSIETLDRDGPGYIFIMTDNLENCLPWSSEHRYKVASSRKPERYVTEFRSRNIDVELIWQVRVQHHLQAVKEVQSCLLEYNLHSNWFKCSLAVIMDTISKIVRKFKWA